MAENDKLEINFRDLARNASQYVFSSTFPSLERMLKTVQTTGEENKEQVEELSSTINSVNIKLNEINSGLKRLNDIMSKSLGILGKILKSQDSSGGSSIMPSGSINNIKNTAGAVLGAGAMMSVIESQHSAPGPVAQSTEGSQSAQPSTSVAGGSTSATSTTDASKMGSPVSGAPAIPAPQPEKKDATAVGGGKTLLIKASTITFDAGEIIFTGGGGQSAGGGGAGTEAAPSSSGSQVSAGLPSGGGQQQSSSGAPQQGGAGGQFMPQQGVTGDNGRLDRSQLTRIPGGLLQASAAQPYMAMVKAAGEENISWGVSDSYRDYPTQVKVAREKGLYSKGGLAATPGRSNHGWGTALDLDFKPNPKASNWLQQNAGRFGFQTIPREAWHWEYKGGAAPAGDTMASKGDQSKIGGDGAAGGGGAQASSGAGSEAPKTGPSASLGASPATSSPSPKPEEKKTTNAAAPVASIPTKGAELNKESTTSEVASVTPPARASMNNIGMGGGGQQKESDVPPNPKITDANKAGNVEPDDAAQRYESLFGMKPKVPTGSGARV